MTWIQKLTESLSSGMEHGRSVRSERARRRERERADAETVREMRWLWRSACVGTALAPMIYTPSGASRAVPLVDHVDLGPPITLTVRIRPGQRVDDFVAAAPLIAPAMGMAEVQVTPFRHQWVRIALIPLYAFAGTAEPPAFE